MYATEQNLLQRFAGGTAQAGDKSIGLALADASAFIDTYLFKRYKLPFEQIPSIIEKICVDLACYFMATADEFVTEDIRKRHDDAIATLRDIAKGIIDLPIKEEGTDVSHENGAVLIDVNPRIFGRGKGY